MSKFLISTNPDNTYFFDKFTDLGVFQNKSVDSYATSAALMAGIEANKD